jgi:hypothetical protein
MNFDEQTDGDYRIYAGAPEAPGDYVAAVVISRMNVRIGKPWEAWRDLGLSGAHRWPSPAEALRYAMAREREVIRSETQRLAC